MDVLIFSLPQSFLHDNLSALSSRSAGMRFGKLHLEHPVEDLGLPGAPKARP